MLQTVVGVRFDSERERFVYHDQDVFEANGVTIRILELCRNPKEQEDIFRSLKQEFDVTDADLQKDIPDILKQLVDSGLLGEV